jgi:hypothetical protein
VLLLGGAEGADTTGFLPRSDDARDESVMEAAGACGARAPGFRARSETARVIAASKAGGIERPKVAPAPKARGSSPVPTREP